MFTKSLVIVKLLNVVLYKCPCQNNCVWSLLIQEEALSSSLLVLVSMCCIIPVILLLVRLEGDVLVWDQGNWDAATQAPAACVMV